MTNQFQLSQEAIAQQCVPQNGNSSGNNGSSHPPTQTKDTGCFRILSLDGGGIRGLITAVWLDRLEQELGSPIGEYFDLIAGTSTGSILACAIAMGRPASELVNLYKERGKEIFPSSFPARLQKWLWSESIDQPFYSDQGLKRVLQDEFGECKFGDLKKLTFVVSYDTLNRRAICFNSSQKERYGNIPVWEICKASSSAPVFFPAHLMEIQQGEASYKVPLIDGGVVASNPTACAIAEGIKHLRKQGKNVSVDNLIVVSLGTGDASQPILIEQIRRWGMFQWMFNITGVMFDGMSLATDHVATNLLCPGNYFRLQARLQRDSLDDVSETNLNALHAFADSRYSSLEFKDIVEKLKEKLLECRENLILSE